MDFIFGILFGTRLLGGIAGGLGGGPPAHFSQPQIVLTAQDVRLDCTVENAFPPRLRQLAENAVPVTMYLFVETRDEIRKETVARSMDEMTLVSDIIGKVYCVTGTRFSDTVRFARLDSAIRSVSTLHGVHVCAADSLKSEGMYSFTAYAVLGTATVEALQNKRIDLMYYWDYKRPTFRTEAYSGAQLRINHK